MKARDIMNTSPDLIRVSDTFAHLIRIPNRVKYYGICVFQ